MFLPHTNTLQTHLAQSYADYELIDIKLSVSYNLRGTISNFLEEISRLSHSVVVAYFFALVTEEGFLISSCYSLELCIQMVISFLSSFAFCFSSFHSYFQGLPRQPFCFFAFLFRGDGLDPCLLYNVMNLCPQFISHSIRSSPLNLFLTSTV